MSVQPRPADTISEKFLLLGLPIFEFGREISTGVFEPYESVGVIDSAELQKALQFAQFRSAQSGTSKLIRELVRQSDATFQVALFRHNAANFRYILASALVTPINAATVAVAADVFTLPSDPLQFASLANQNLLEAPTPTLAPAEITDEDLGLGQGGTFGETLGDFALDFKILVVADVTSFTVTPAGGAPVAKTVVNVAPGAGEVQIVEGAVATGGQVLFFAGEAPASGAAVEATYQPSFGPLVLNTDFFVDFPPGRCRVTGPYGGDADRFRVGQPMTAGYSYTQPQATRIQPLTQFVHPGRGRIRQLTDVGENLIWTIPKGQVRLTDDAFAFNRDDFTRSVLAFNLLEDLTNQAAPFGDLDIYEEGTF